MRVVSMCGSLGLESTNRLAVDVASAHLRDSDMVERVTDVPLSAVPMFNPELVDDAPAAVREMRALLEGADGIMVAAPEYAGGLAGGIKNALDWLVGSASIYHRPVVVLSAGSTGGEFAVAQLVQTLSWQGALTVGTLGIRSPRTKITAGQGYTDSVTIELICRWVDDLVDAMSMSPQDLLARTRAVVGPFSIDAARFGELSERRT